MNGIQLLRLLDVLPVTSMRNAPGVSPRSIIVRCSELHNVESVLFNGVPAPEFVVYSQHELIAQVPEALEDAIITEVAVLSTAASLTQRSLIEFGIGSRVKRLSGVQRLIQTFVRMLLRTPGSNIFHPELGGGLYASIGSNVTKRTAADIAIAINRTKQQIIALQTPVSTIPPEERLLSAEVVGCTEDPHNASIYVTIVLTSHARQRSAATFIG